MGGYNHADSHIRNISLDWGFLEFMDHAHDGFLNCFKVEPQI
jgi:hypothetical protein